MSYEDLERQYYGCSNSTPTDSEGVNPRELFYFFGPRFVFFHPRHPSERFDQCQENIILLSKRYLIHYIRHMNRAKCILYEIHKLWNRVYLNFKIHCRLTVINLNERSNMYTHCDNNGIGILCYTILINTVLINSEKWDAYNIKCGWKCIFLISNTYNSFKKLFNN